MFRTSSVGCVIRNGPIACVIYAAKSTEDRRGSIAGQLRECFQIERIYPMNEPEHLTRDLRVAAPKLEQLSPAMEREAIDLLATLLVDLAGRNADGYGKNSRNDVPRSG